MSTILKALKQAEKDSPDQGGGNHPSFNVQTTLSSRMQQQKRSSFLSLTKVEILAALVFVMAIFAYPLFFMNKTTAPQIPDSNEQSQRLNTHPDSVKTPKQVISKLTPKPSGQPEISNQILPKSENESFDLRKTPNKTVLKPESVNQIPAGQSIPIKAKEKITSPSDSNHINRFIDKAKSELTDAMETIPDDTAPLVVEEAGLSQSEKKNILKNEKKIVTKNRSEQPLPFLENKNLRIQAISWSKDPANRIAVINNRVLQEGKSVQGYRLVIIEKDSVILQYSGKKYRLEFKYR